MFGKVFQSYCLLKLCAKDYTKYFIWIIWFTSNNLKRQVLFLFISILRINLEMVGLSNSHHQKVAEPRYKHCLSSEPAFWRNNITLIFPNDKISIYLKVKQIPLIKVLCFLNTIHFRGTYLEFFILFSRLRFLFCF